MKKQRKDLKWLVLGAVIIGMIVIGVGTRLYLIKDVGKNDKIENNNKEQNVKDNDEKLELNNNINDKEQNAEESEIKPEEVTQQEEVQQKPVEEQNKTESINNNVTNIKPKENQQKPVEEPKPVEPPKQKTPWEELGISEYDYYNKPEINWQVVDFSVEEYGSQANAKQACIDAGSNNTELERYTFSCDETYSYSHKLLGYHIRYTIIP